MGAPWIAVNIRTEKQVMLGKRKSHEHQNVFQNHLNTQEKLCLCMHLMEFKKFQDFLKIPMFCLVAFRFREMREPSPQNMHQ